MTKWTEEEDKKLISIYSTNDYQELVKCFPGRKLDAIRYHARQIGLSRNVPRKNVWSDKEEQILIDNYSILPLDELMRLLPGRSVMSIYQRAFRLRLEKTKPEPRPKPEPKPKPKPEPRPIEVKKINPIKLANWEKQILAEFGGRLSEVELKMLLPRRSITEIREILSWLGITST